MHIYYIHPLHTGYLTSYNRFIPSREGIDLQAAFNLIGDQSSPSTGKSNKRVTHGEIDAQKGMYSNKK